MENPYTTPLLILAALVAILIGAHFFYGTSVGKPSSLSNESPVPIAPVLSEQAKRQVMQELASQSSSTMAITEKEQILQKTRSTAAASDKTGTSSASSEEQMEILRALRYSE